MVIMPSSSPWALLPPMDPIRSLLHVNNTPTYQSFSSTRFKLPASSHRLTASCFPFEGSVYKQELEAAVDVVEKACHLCNTVRKSMVVDGKEQMNKSDQTPVTVADFGIQALVSMELGRLFPSIPLVAEEDASYLRMNLKEAESAKAYKTPLVDMVVEAVSKVASTSVGPVTNDIILEAIDRGGDLSSDTHPRKEIPTFWVLDPIDGTRGFLEGGDSLYVIGLALVVNGRLVLGVMGCPSVTHSKMKSRTGRRLIQSLDKLMKRQNEEISGVLVAACNGYGSWIKPLSLVGQGTNTSLVDQEFVQCLVDGSSTLDTAWCGLSRHEDWNLSPLAHIMDSTSVFSSDFVLHFCCGSLCKYMAVAVGAVSVVLLPQVKKHIKERVADAAEPHLLWKIKKLRLQQGKEGYFLEMDVAAEMREDVK